MYTHLKSLPIEMNFEILRSDIVQFRTLQFASTTSQLRWMLLLINEQLFIRLCTYILDETIKRETVELKNIFHSYIAGNHWCLPETKQKKRKEHTQNVTKIIEKNSKNR